MVKKLLTLIILPLLCASTLAQTSKHGSYLVSSDDGETISVMYDETVDGDKLNATLLHPRSLLLSEDEQNILLMDHNGYSMRVVDKFGNVKATEFEVGRAPIGNKKKFIVGSLLHGSDNIIVQISSEDNYMPYLFAGREAKDDEPYEEEGELVKTNMSEAWFNVPCCITKINGKGWVFITESGKNNFRFIDKAGVIWPIRGLEHLPDNPTVNLLKEHNGNLYALTSYAVYKINFDVETKQANIIEKWNNNESGTIDFDDKDTQFYNLEGIAFDNRQVVVTDSDTGKILELLPNNQSKTLIQMPCSGIDHEENEICKVSLPNEDEVYNSLNGIIKNPWNEGYIVADTMMNALYKIEGNHVSLFTGQVKNTNYLKEVTGPGVK